MKKELGLEVNGNTVKWIPEHEGRYAARIDGTIVSYMQSSPKILKDSSHEKGYRKINISKELEPVKTWRLHRLIAMTFIDNAEPDEYTEIDHIDMNRANNSASNLRWCTGTMNKHYAYKVKHGEDWTPKHKPTKEEILERKKQLEIQKQEKRDAMAYGSVEAMIEATGKKVTVNGIIYKSTREAARFICSEPDVVGKVETVRKEIQRMVNGKRNPWTYLGRFKIDKV